MKIYLASSWRNQHYPDTLLLLRQWGHVVFDFREANKAFHWSDIDPAWQSWSPRIFRFNLQDEKAVIGFNNNFEGMKWADICVLQNPCGRSAHLEAGWFIGRGKPVIIFATEGEPEFMYKMADYIVIDTTELKDALKIVEQERALYLGG